VQSQEIKELDTGFRRCDDELAVAAPTLPPCL